MQNRSSAVMEQRAPASVEDPDEIRALWRKLDWFATPPWASRAGAELVKHHDPSAALIWEPAAGDGIMAAALKETFDQVTASDIYPQARDVLQINFWDAIESSEFPAFDWIITNPPFKHAEEFVRLGLTRARRGVAVLCRVAFLETSGRYELHERHLAEVAIFCERVPMQLGPWDPACSTATAYAWFVFDRYATKGEHKLSLIPPGTRERLTKADDAQRFARAPDLPLMETNR